MRSPGSNGEVAEVLARLFTMPSNKSDPEHTSEVWLMTLEGQPLCSIVYAFTRFIRDPSRSFRPTSGQFLAVVEEHANRVRHKIKTLKEAIENEKGAGA